ncbi:DUF3179 domain-containing protein [Hyunsoonleella sp. SJ7]|uniref:DUF3179 domain-containing protein n=1 Tax=Hyunsoonleella aquatilis TaxID=2762758 RepID=A0A923HAP9_9FLAO|nr:DUF3179 domain-containing (seleno)protein [Hyunsoonleella aquatilis]MBC3757511.1 DUF3179 domain-containing protein [Hyunsoonleella aquatilis]
MILAITALLLALAIAFGRQTAVFGKVKLALWFFSYFEQKRLLFTIVSLGLLALAIYNHSFSITLIWFGTITLLLLLFSFFFDMKFLFPEIKKVEKGIPNNFPESTKIIGISIDHLAVAYPLEEVVIPRHIINDMIDDKPVLISYCAICTSALAFDSKMNNENLYFKVAGVWRRNMIIYDTKTHSLWQQATGECIYGKMKGSQLTLVSGENTTLGEWKKKYPKTYFATKCIEARKGYVSREFMLKAINFITPKVLVPGFTDLSDLPVRETVFGIDYNGISKAYPKSEIEGLDVFMDDYGPKKIKLEYNKTSDYLTASDINENKEIIVEKHWWLGWKEFHPDTEIWKKAHNKI